MEGVGVVLPLGYAGDHAEALTVHADEAAGQALGGGSDQGVVQPALPADAVGEGAHGADDLQAQVLAFLALAVMGAAQGLQAFRQADEADGQRTVLEHLANLVIPVQLFGVDPHALAHQEG